VRRAAGVAAALVLLGTAGCGARGAVGHTTAPPGAGLEMPQVRGAHVAALRTDASGEVRLSLFIDAGSRDGAPPQVAFVAASVAAEAAGPPFEARVVPDGTEIHGRCPSSDMPACVAALGRALSTRDVTPDALTRAHRVLGVRRRRARTDEGRLVHGLAVRALLGEEAAAGLDPLGEPADDRSADANAVRAFLAAHFGPTRAFLAASGDLEPERVMAAVKKEWGEVPKAAGARAARAPLAPRSSAAVEVGRRGHVAVAAVVSSAAHGAAAARMVLEGGLEGRLEEQEPVAVDAHAFELRGGSLLLVRTSPVSQVRRASRTLAFEVGRAALEASLPDAHGATGAAGDADPARALGELWLVRDDEARAARRAVPGDAPVAMGVGAIVAGGRADRTGKADPDAEVRRTAQARLTAELRRALAALAPARRGGVHDGGAAVVLENGARIDVRRIAAHRRARIEVRVEGGVVEEPPLLHGRTAVLTTAMTHGCVGRPRDALRLRLRQLGASLVPVVTGDAFGLVLDVPREGWREGLDLALACLMAPDLTSAGVEHARHALLTALGQEPPYRAWAGAAVAPNAPGVVAPWGSRDAVKALARHDLMAAHGSAVVGARVRVKVEGDAPPAEVVERAARRLAQLQRGSVPPDARPGEALRDPSFLTTGGEKVASVLAFRVAGEVSDGRATELARRLAAALGGDPGLRVVWSDGGRAPWGGWVAAAVVLPFEGVPSLADRMAGIVRTAAEGAGLTLTGLPTLVVGPFVEP
jgi:predicted Zn-dependent peptidase